MPEYIWQYSKYYGDMMATTKRLYDNGEYYTSVTLLFNVTELICKAVKDDYAGNFSNDLKWLNEHGLMAFSLIRRKASLPIPLTG